MKKYAQLEYSFTDAEIDPKSREALKKQFNNLPKHWYKRMSRYNWKIVVVDELVDVEDEIPLIFSVSFDEMTIYLNSSSSDALRNGVYKAIAGYIIAQHMTFDDSVVFQVLVDENIFKTIECFSELPQNVQNVFVSNGWKIRISSEYLMDSPDCEGYCDPNVKKIFFKAAAERFKSSLWHEVGHFIDFQCDYPSESPEFEEVFKKEKGYLMRENTTYELYKYCTMNLQEYFAESFANYMNDSYRLQMVAPGTFGIIDRIVR